MKRRTVLGILALGPVTLPALAQIEKRDAVYPLVGPYNYALRKHHNVAYRYLNVIDIGHGELAEVLITNQGREERAVPSLEERLFGRVTQMFLDPKKAPNLAVAEETVAPESMKVAPRLNKAFDWTHTLHRQVYDILAMDLATEKKTKYIREAHDWYRRDRAIAFPGVLKTHDLMEHQWFSQYWRQKYPRFNGAIWAYHWYQLRLNEVLLEPDKARRDAAVTETTAEFRAMFENNELLPRHMPMAHTIAPRFLADFPEIANTFDNLHSFHDIYNDILAHPQITDKRAEVYKQLDGYLSAHQDLESAPMEPLPPGLSREEHRRLNQLQHLEHMAMMVMPVTQQMAFLQASWEERAALVERVRPLMARTWPNFEKKHASMSHQHSQN